MLLLTLFFAPQFAAAGNPREPELILPDTHWEMITGAIVTGGGWWAMADSGSKKRAKHAAGSAGGTDVRSFFKPILRNAPERLASLSAAANMTLGIVATVTATNADTANDTNATATNTAITDVAATATAAASSSSAGTTATVVAPGAHEARPGMLDGETMCRVGQTHRPRKHASKRVKEWLMPSDSDSDGCDRPDPEPRAQPLNTVGSPSPRTPAPTASAPGENLYNPAAPVINLNLSGTITGGVHTSVTTNTTVTVNGVDTAVETRWRSGSAQGSLQPGTMHVFTPNQPGDITGIGEPKKTAFDMMRPGSSPRPRCCMPLDNQPCSFVTACRRGWGAGHGTACCAAV